MPIQKLGAKSPLDDGVEGALICSKLTPDRIACMPSGTLPLLYRELRGPVSCRMMAR
jgi:hypothetical protein